MRVGIITWHYFDNVGSNLQAYALQQTVTNMGHDVKIINYRFPGSEESFVKKCIKNFFITIDRLFPNLLDERLRFGSLKFQKERLRCTEVVRTKEALEKLAQSFDAIICGSDQIWAPNCFRDVYMLSFVDGNIRKISYAPSIGLNDIPDELRSLYRKWIGRLDYVSVREDKGVELLKKCCQIEATQVLDPTLLLTATDWAKVYEKEKSLKGQYIFCYLLGDKIWIRDKIRDFANRVGMKVVIFSSHIKDEEYADEYFNRMGSPKFLRCLSEATYVLTDSFHGLLFSIQFHKNVYVFDRYDNEEEQCQNSRIESILRLLGIEERRVSRETIIQISEIDYGKVDNRLVCARRKSLEFLKNALK